MKMVFVNIFALMFLNISAQELITNGSFESYYLCPKKPSSFAEYKFLPGWYNPTKATPDYYNKCNNKKVGVPENSLGNQKAKTGNGYVGIILSGTGKYREYLQTKIRTPLIEDQLYCFSLYISLAEYSKYWCNNFGVFFSKHEIRKRSMNNIKRIPQIENKIELNVMDDWINFYGTYKAHGGEKFLTIGNFYADYEINQFETDSYIICNDKLKNQFRDYAYYYIDDISLIKITKENDCECKNETEKVDTIFKNILDTIQVGEIVRLKNIFFELNKSELLAVSFDELYKVYELLKNNKKIRIEIIGHTDNLGSNEYNLELSILRARTVYTYLINKGIDKNRISYKGFGKAFPISDNESEEGRALNRRVELKILEK